jgi:hypothetical protein
MSRYLGRVLARSAGRPLGQIQATPPMRWPGAGGDPDGATDRAADGAPETGGSDRADTTRPATGESIPAGRDDPGRGSDPADRGERRPSDAGSIEARPRGRSAGDSPPSDERVRIVRVGGDPPRPSPTTPPPPEPSPSPEPRVEPPGRARWTGADEHVPRPSVVAERPVAPAVPSSTEPRSAPSRTTRPPEPGAIVVAAPHSHPATPREPTRPEVVIGRVSVVVETSRPAAPAPQPTVRAAPAARPGDDGPGLASRFGLGQL